MSEIQCAVLFRLWQSKDELRDANGHSYHVTATRSGGAFERSNAVRNDTVLYFQDRVCQGIHSRNEPCASMSDEM